MFSRIVLDAASLNAAAAHWLSEHRDFPVNGITVSGKEGKIHILLTGVPVLKRKVNLEATVVLGYENDLLSCRLQLSGVGGVVQKTLSFLKIDKLLLRFFPILRGNDVMIVRGAEHCEIRIPALTVKRRAEQSLTLKHFGRVLRVQTAPTPHELLIIDFMLTPPPEVITE